VTSARRILVVDWSASSKPVTGKNSIHLADNSGWLKNPRTRYEAMEELRSRLRGSDRWLVAFDFPFGIPDGVSKFRTWKEFWRACCKVEDDARQQNNRFEFAARLNQTHKTRFWGRPQQQSIPGLEMTRQWPSGPWEKRATDNDCPQAQSPWKLFGTGSVGSQMLLGLRHLHELRFESAFSSETTVWPFETGWADSPRRILLAEVWPSHPVFAEQIRAEKNSVRDAAQVLGTARYLAKKGVYLRALASTPDCFGRPDAVTRLEGCMLVPKKQTLKNPEVKLKTQKLTMAEALVKYLCAQFIEVDGKTVPLFAGVFAIFGHGNVTCLGPALHAARRKLPTWRGQNEQSMALAAAAFAKASRRRRIMVATSSIGPGATNMVTAAAVAHANRLPLLLLAGDTFAGRVPDPVLQQVEHFHDPTLTVNDAFKAVTRYWDRIVRPEQIISSLPQAVAAMLDPAGCGPAFFALPQDVQAEAFDYPAAFFQRTVHHIPQPRPEKARLAEAVEVLRAAKKPLLIAGGGVHYALATRRLAAFARKHGVPVAETVAGRAALVHDHRLNAGPIGVIGSSSANALAAEADAVLAVGSRLQDFTTGSWSVFGNPAMRLITLNTARWDAHKHRALAVVADADAGLKELGTALGNWRAPAAWGRKAAAEYRKWNATVDRHSGPTKAVPPSYAQVVGAVNRACGRDDLALTAAGGLPGELCKNWKAKSAGTFDCEFGFSCMGYEIAGGLGARMARGNDGEVIVFVGDGSYLMMNSEIVGSVMTGHKLIIIVCDNAGYAVINRLQNDKGGASFNNLFADCRAKRQVAVDFVAHAQSMGADGEAVETVEELQRAFARARQSARTYIISIRVHPHQWTPGDAWWDVGVPQVSARAKVRAAKKDHEQARRRHRQRVGV